MSFGAAPATHQLLIGHLPPVKCGPFLEQETGGDEDGSRNRKISFSYQCDRMCVRVCGTTFLWTIFVFLPFFGQGQRQKLPYRNLGVGKNVAKLD